MGIQQKQSDEAIPDDFKVEWGLTPAQVKQAQQKDKFCKEQYNKILKGSLPGTHPYYIKDGILMRYTTDNKQRFETIVVPEHYTLALLRLAHDELGHNGSSRTYMMLRRLYFWKGMKPQVFKYVKLYLILFTKKQSDSEIYTWTFYCTFISYATYFYGSHW